MRGSCDEVLRGNRVAEGVKGISFTKKETDRKKVKLKPNNTAQSILCTKARGLTRQTRLHNLAQTLPSYNEQFKTTIALNGL